jgi:hypothetical protein
VQKPISFLYFDNLYVQMLIFFYTLTFCTCRCPYFLILLPSARAETHFLFILW